jgi:Cys-tRNA(Pro)/Cys-tRNA(Cys) deacylase
MKKTNAMRILDGAGIRYETMSYNDDGEHELERGAAEGIAAKLGIPPEQVYKTIVMRTDTKEIIVFCQSALHEINLKKARAACGAKELAPVKPDELVALTGYVRGGCSPVGMKRPFRTFMDQTMTRYDTIYISAGLRGEQIVINPSDLISITNAHVCDLILE